MDLDHGESGGAEPSCESREPAVDGSGGAKALQKRHSQKWRDDMKKHAGEDQEAARKLRHKLEDCAVDLTIAVDRLSRLAGMEKEAMEEEGPGYIKQKVIEESRSRQKQKSAKKAAKRPPSIEAKTRKRSQFADVPIIYSRPRRKVKISHPMESDEESEASEWGEEEDLRPIEVEASDNSDEDDQEMSSDFLQDAISDLLSQLKVDRRLRLLEKLSSHYGSREGMTMQDEEKLRVMERTLHGLVIETESAAQRYDIQIATLKMRIQEITEDYWEKKHKLKTAMKAREEEMKKRFKKKSTKLEEEIQAEKDSAKEEQRPKRVVADLPDATPEASLQETAEAGTPSPTTGLLSVEDLEEISRAQDKIAALKVKAELENNRASALGDLEGLVQDALSDRAAEAAEQDEAEAPTEDAVAEQDEGEAPTLDAVSPLETQNSSEQNQEPRSRRRRLSSSQMKAFPEWHQQEGTVPAPEVPALEVSQVEEVTDKLEQELSKQPGIAPMQGTFGKIESVEERKQRERAEALERIEREFDAQRALQKKTTHELQEQMTTLNSELKDLNLDQRRTSRAIEEVLSKVGDFQEMYRKAKEADDSSGESDEDSDDSVDLVDLFDKFKSKRTADLEDRQEDEGTEQKTKGRQMEGKDDLPALSTAVPFDGENKEQGVKEAWQAHQDEIEEQAHQYLQQEATSIQLEEQHQDSEQSKELQKRLKNLDISGDELARQDAYVETVEGFIERSKERALAYAQLSQGACSIAIEALTKIKVAWKESEAADADGSEDEAVSRLTDCLSSRLASLREALSKLPCKEEKEDRVVVPKERIDALKQEVSAQRAGLDGFREKWNAIQHMVRQGEVARATGQEAEQFRLNVIRACREGIADSSSSPDT